MSVKLQEIKKIVESEEEFDLENEQILFIRVSCFESSPDQDDIHFISLVIKHAPDLFSYQYFITLDELGDNMVPGSFNYRTEEESMSDDNSTYQRFLNEAEKGGVSVVTNWEIPCSDLNDMEEVIKRVDLVTGNHANLFAIEQA